MVQKKPAPLSAAERARNYRERKKSEALEAEAAAAAARDARDADTPSQNPPASPPRRISMRESIDEAIAAMKWLKPSDKAAEDAARLYAGLIDETLERDPTATGKAASLGQLLARWLHELCGTPTVRLQHELRSLRIAAGLTEPGGENGDKPVEGTPQRAGEATVTPISRPPKRARA